LRAGEVRTGEVRVGQVRVGEVRAGQLDHLAVVSDSPASDDGGSCLHVGARSMLWRLRAGLGRWPVLAGVLTDERGQDFHDRGMVPGRIAGDALQRVDAADTHVELVRTELLDRL